MDKEILCIPKAPFFQVGVEDVHDIRDVKQFLDESGSWVDRARAETSETYTQIIPYVLVLNGDRRRGVVTEILSAERLPGGNEERLHGQVALGFGGHVKRIGTSTAWEALVVAVRQELREELGVRLQHGQFPHLHGLLHDDSNEVGRVHTGMVFSVWVEQFEEGISEIASQEPDKLRTLWLDRTGLGMVHDRMENWAQMVSLVMEPWGLAPVLYDQ